MRPFATLLSATPPAMQRRVDPVRGVRRARQPEQDVLGHRLDARRHVGVVLVLGRELAEVAGRRAEVRRVPGGRREERPLRSRGAPKSATNGRL